MKLLQNTKNKVTKNENGENVSHLEITEAVLAHCNNDYNFQQWLSTWSKSLV